MTFPDIEEAHLTWLTSTFPALAGTVAQPRFHVGTVTPSNLQERFPFVRVRRGGGARTFREDYPLMDYDVFDSTRKGAYDLSQEIQNALLVPLLSIAGVRIDSVEVETAPSLLPWEAQGTIRFGFTNNLSLRR